jgi:glycosyltransferase involved in cell wall biosynthesis
MGVLFVVPAHDERDALPGVVADLRERYPQGDVVVVDDGSTDGTGATARSLGVEVLDLPCNLGIGAAVQTGLMLARDRGYAVAVQFDGDGQHRADQLEALIRPIQAGEADVVIGSRFLQGARYSAPPLRRLGMAILRWIDSWLAGQPLTDTTSGFRAYGPSAIAFLATAYPSDYPEPESVVTLVRQGFRVREVAVEMRERQGGSSSITPWRSGYYMLKVLLAIAVDLTRRPAERGTHELAGADRRHRG